MTAPFVISTKWDTYLEWITNWHYPELRGYFTLKSLLHSGLKQVMSLFTLGSARSVLVVALVYCFPDVVNVIMALISPYTNQPFIVPIRRTSIVSWDPLANGVKVVEKITVCAKLSEDLSVIRSDRLIGFVWPKRFYYNCYGGCRIDIYLHHV